MTQQRQARTARTVLVMAVATVGIATIEVLTSGRVDPDEKANLDQSEPRIDALDDALMLQAADEVLRMWDEQYKTTDEYRDFVTAVLRQYQRLLKARAEKNKDGGASNDTRKLRTDHDPGETMRP